MATKQRIERPAQTIKPIVKPISADLKVKASNAFQSIVNAIKAKHLA